MLKFISSERSIGQTNGKSVVWMIGSSYFWIGHIAAVRPHRGLDSRVSVGRTDSESDGWTDGPKIVPTPSPLHVPLIPRLFPFLLLSPAVTRLPRAHCHLAIDSAVAASAGSPAAAQAPLSVRIYRGRAVSLAPILEQCALPCSSTPGRWPLYIRIIRDRRKLILAQ